MLAGCMYHISLQAAAEPCYWAPQFEMIIYALCEMIIYAVVFAAALKGRTGFPAEQGALLSLLSAGLCVLWRGTRLGRDTG